jgi:protein-tyrosine phosphatase
MSRFIDTHSHGLYAVDDGVQDAEGMLRFLKIAAEHQTKLLFMTPHLINGGKYHASRALLDQRMAEVAALICDHHLDLEVRLGAEIYLDEAGLTMIRQKEHLPYSGTNYVLVESVPPYDVQLLDAALIELKKQGQRMLIAHPERYFRDTRKCLRVTRRWIEQGAYLSVNTTSFLSNSRPWVLKNALHLLNNGLVHVMASDAHHAPGRREPRLDDGYDLVAKWMGKPVADGLCSLNPQRLADNEALMSLPLPRGVWKWGLRTLRQQAHVHRLTPKPVKKGR